MNVKHPLPSLSVDQPPPARLGSFVEIARWQAERIGDQPAYTFLTPGEAKVEPINYRELDSRLRATAAALLEQGKPGDRVLIVQHPGLDYIASLLGCLYAGMVAVPVYPIDVFRLRHTLPRLQAVTRDADARLILTSGDALGASSGESVEKGVVSALWGLGVEGVLRTDQIDPAIQERYVDRNPRENDVAILQYTSGTTGNPRGVVLRHRHLLANAQQIYTRFHAPNAVCVFWLPPYHDMGLVGGLLLPLYAGRISVLMSPTSFVQDPICWLRAISEYGGTTTASPNFGYELCCRKIPEDAIGSLDLSSMRVAISGAEPIRASTLRAFAERFAPCGFRHAAFTPAYGMAEATLAITGKTLDDEPVSTLFDAATLQQSRIASAVSQDLEQGSTPNTKRLEIVSCGAPVDQTEVIIVDPESRIPLPSDRVGEIWVRGIAVAGEYWRRDDLNTSTFHAQPQRPDTPVVESQPSKTPSFARIGEPARSIRPESGYLRTGDIGFIHQGELYVSGRLKDMIIIAGRNFFPQDIEAAIQALDPLLKVDGGAAFGLTPDERPIASEPNNGNVNAEGERLVIVQEVLRPKKFDPLAMVDRIRTTLAQQFELNVATIVFVAAGSLSKTSSGKLQRSRCKAEFLAGELTILHRWDAAEHAANDTPLTPNRSAKASPSETPDDNPRTRRDAIAIKLAPLWCEALRLENASEEQHFLDHGGHSLAALSLLSRVRDTFGVIVDFDTLFRAPRFGQLVDELAGIVDGAGRDNGSLTLTPNHSVVAPSRAASQSEDRPVELTPSQRRFWLLDSLELRQAFLHVELTIRLHGDLDIDRLARRVEGLPLRHAGLRVRIRVDASGTPRPDYDNNAPLRLDRFDLRQEPADGLEEALRKLRLDFVDRRFDLADGPTIRIALATRPDGDHDLILAAHHLACDGASLLLLVEDLAGDDSASQARGEASDDLAALARVVSNTLAIDESALDYWDDRLHGVPTDARLTVVPTDTRLTISPQHPSDDSLGDSSRYRRTDLPAALIERLRERSRQWGVTPFEILLAGWHLLLGRYTESDDIVIGVPTAGRDVPMAERAIGCFINTLPVRLGGGIIEGNRQDESFREWVMRASQLWRGDLRHAAVPIDAIIDRLAPERSETRLPLIQHLFLHQPPAPSGLKIADATCVDFGSDYATLAAYDTALVCQWRSGASGSQPVSCELGIAVNPTQASPAITKQWLDGLVALLQGGLARPETPLSKLPFAGNDELRKRDAANVATTFHRPIATTLELFRNRRELTPDATAVIDRDGELTFADLDLISDRLARILIAHGVRPGSFVALRLSRGRCIPIAAIAVWKAGAAYLPLDPTYPEDRIADVLDDASPAWTLTDSDIDEATQTASDQDPLKRLTIPGTKPSAPAYLIYTSGSTGKPKGVVIGHDNLSNVLLAFARSPGFGTGDRILAATTMSFDISILELFLPLTTGGTSVIAPASLSEDPDWVVQWLDRHAVDVIQATPSSLRMMLASGWTPRNSQTIWCGGEPMHADIAEAILGQGARLWNVYGPTETTVWSLAGEVTAPLSLPISIGRPIDSTTIRIVDPHGRDVAEGVPGELWIGGLGVGRGYWNRPELTAQRFVTLPIGRRFYRTGDRVRRLDDGTLEFLGRNDRQIKLRGQRVELGEIEAAILRLTDIREAAVVAVDHSPTDRRLVGYYRCDTPAIVPPADLRRFLQQVLAPHQIPTTLVPLGAIPHTPAGKVDYRRLPSIECLGLADTDHPGDETAPRTDRRPTSTPTEETLAKLWREVLGEIDIAPDDHFFRLGGHSLMAAQLFARIRGHWRINLPLREIYSHPTLGGLATRIDSEVASATAISNDAAPGQGPATPDRDDDSLAGYLQRRASGQTPPPQVPPLSPAEQRLWFIDQLEPTHPFYNLPLAATIDGPLDVELLWRCVDAIVDRHETLRSTYSLIDGKPVRRIAPAVHVNRHSIDLSRQTDPAAALRDCVAAQSRLPFDLAAGPLLRVIHWQLDTDRHAILLVMHHIVSDGWSMSVMMRELSELYRQGSANRPLALPPIALPKLKVRYQDYAAWQEDFLTPDRVEPTLKYWEQELDNAVETLDLPVDFPRPAIQDFSGATRTLEIPESVSDRVRRLAEQLEVTPFSVLVSAYGLVLSRWSNRRDLTIGTAVANRTEPLIEPLIGFFVNTVMLRQRASGTESFAELVRQTHTRATEAIGHQHVPFERVVGRLAKRRDRSHSPLFQAAFVLQNAPDALVPADGLTIRPVPIDNGTAKFDVTMLLGQSERRFHGHIEYRTSLFRDVTIQRLGDSFLTLLEAAVNDADSPIDSLPIVPVAQRSAILGHSITPATSPTFGTAKDAVPPRTLTEAIRRSCTRHRDLVAIRHGIRSLRYAELDAFADRIAGGLRCEAGIGRGIRHQSPRRSPDTTDRVLVYLPRSIDQIASSIAAMRLGAAFVPVDTQVPLGRLVAIIDDLRPSAIVAPAGRTTEIEQAIAAGSLPAVPCLAASDWASRDDGSRPAVAIEPDDLAYLIFTSGSTGTPKGIAIHHEAITNFVSGFVDLMGIGPGTTYGHLFSTSFDGALGDIYPVLAAGGCLEIIDQETVLDPPRLATELTRRQVDSLALTPATLATLNPAQLPTVKRILSAGAPLSGELAARWLPTHQLVNGYGPTECAIGVSIRHLDPSDVSFPAVGRPMPGTSIYVLDPLGRIVPDGVIGEVHIGGRGVGLGYWHRPELTANAFVPDPFAAQAHDPNRPARMFRTGDLGRWNHQGELEIVGRRDEQVKLRGFRIEPSEIAAVIEKVPGIAHAAVIADGDDSADEGLGRRLIAYVVPAQDAPTTDLKADAEIGSGQQTPHRGSESEQIENWKRLFDESQRASSVVLDPENHFAGWSSVITGRPIPVDQMRHWADSAASRIKELRPRRVLEIGCGTGLILLRVADAVEHYTGIDLLESALNQLRRTLDSRPELAAKVSLHCRQADDLQGLPTGGFDTIILNSVVQYFPSPDYLIRVLQGAQKLLAPAGRIFLGDLRNARLQRAFAIAVESHRRGNEPLTVSQFEARIRSRIDHDEELLVDPDLKSLLRPHLSRLVEVQNRLKTAIGNNELNRFRFDAVLAFDEPIAPNNHHGPNHHWPNHHGARRHFGHRATRQASRSWAFINHNVANEVAIDQRLSSSPADRPIDEVIAEAQRSIGHAATPAALAAQASRIAIGSGPDAVTGPEAVIRFDWHPESPEQLIAIPSFEGFALAPRPLRRLKRSWRRLAKSARAGSASHPHPHASFDRAPRIDATKIGSSRPSVRRDANDLVTRVKKELQHRLPPYMVPSALVVIDRLPLTLQGKLDRAALPPPPVRRSTTDQPIRAPRTRSEQTLVEIWEELLEVSPIGIDDDFFELGGHSMLAVRMVSAVQQQTGKTLPLAALFRAPTIERLAESLDQPDLGPTTLVPLAIGGSAAPLFCIHPAGGTVFCYRELADAFAGGRPVFGVQARGLDGAQPPHTTATEMASDYAHAIVSAHPTGPIHLVGWSLGGNIAFEVARCLRDLGRDVGLLALLDAGLISAETELTEEDFLPLIAALFPGQKAESLEAIRQKSPEQQLAYFIEQASIAGIIPEETAEVGPHIFDVFQANIKAVHEHPTESYDGPLLLIRPADQAKTGELFNDPALGWGKLVREVRVETVSGDHAHMLQQPAVAQIAAILRNALSI